MSGRKTRRLATLVVLASATEAVIGCTYDFTIGDGTPDGGSGVAEAGAASTTTTTRTDAGAQTRAVADAGRADAALALLANGEPCTTESEESTECLSGICRYQSGKQRMHAGLFCNVPCDLAGQQDPSCTPLTAFLRCGYDGFCVVR